MRGPEAYAASPADMIVVLAGDRSGSRILKAAELAKAGLAPSVLVSNCKILYGHPECELAIEFATRHGYSPDLFIATAWLADSTRAEAQNVIEVLRQRRVRKVIIVTTVWHTARAVRIYRRLAPELTFDIVGTEDPDYRDGKWWRNRNGRKAFFLEGLKTIADYLRI